MKTILSICSVALALTGCISIVQPPESSYNGSYLQMFDGTGSFILQQDTGSDRECAFAAANMSKLTRGKYTAFCTKTNNPNVNHIATIRIDANTYNNILFIGADACGKFLVDNAKDLDVASYCRYWGTR